MNPIYENAPRVNDALVTAQEDFFASTYNLSDPDQFINSALDMMLAIVNAHAGSFFVWDECLKEFILRSARGPYRERMNNAHVKLREGILGWVGDQGHSVLVKDIQEDERFQIIKRMGTYRSFSFISLPVTFNNKLIGIINITERENLVPFSEEDFFQAQSFAHITGIALENLRLVSRLKKENVDLHEALSQSRQVRKESEAFISIGKLAANLAHELNNPLDSIRRYVNLALEQVLEDSLAREYLLKTKQGVRRAIQVIRGLLHFSSERHKTSLRTVEVHDLIDKTLDNLLQDSNFQNIRIQKRFYGMPVRVPDAGLQLVLSNLYENACHAMGGSGIIHIATEILESKIRIVVEDNGPGIPETIKLRIFEPFFSTKPEREGVGVGLALCREMVERSGGQIYCENCGGKGARFIITLPRLNKPV